MSFPPAGGYLPHFYVGLYIVEIVLVLNTAVIVLDWRSALINQSVGLCYYKKNVDIYLSAHYEIVE